MGLEDRKLFGETHRDGDATRYSEGTPVPLRASKKGEIYTDSVAKGRTAIAAEGGYFVATNPTPGTGIAGITATGAFSDAESLITIRNGGSGDNPKWLYLDYIRLQITAAGTSGSDVLYTMKTDSGNERWASGGSALTPVNVNQGSSVATSATIHVGALVTDAATSAARLVGNGVLRTVIRVVGDEYLFDFGGDVRSGASSLFEGLLVSRQVIPCVPVILPPSTQLVFSMYATAEAAASSYELEIGYYER